MNGKDCLLKQTMWRFIDQSSVGPSFSALQSFAMDDTLCHVSGLGLTDAVARAWVHQDTVVLGIQDSRLPFLEKGIDYLNEMGQSVIIRNSGGLAVVLDKGVLNISLVFTEEQRKIEIDRGYETMVTLIRDMFKEYDQNIEAKEIVGSYCPGSYDLSINGKKFAGISQRRIRKGVAVQIYLCINGSGSKRAEMIKHFYEIAKNDVETKFQYPTIQPNVMASLSELLGVELSVQEVIQKLLQSLHEHSEQIYTKPLSEKESEMYQLYVTRMEERKQMIGCP
mgnify:FL=1